jgi:DNA-binding MarR family transcriptional regulator
MAAVTSLMRAQAIMIARAEAILRPLGLSFARYELLTLLSFTRRGTLPMARAGALLQVHPTSITNAVQRLEKAGLVSREPHPGDGRAALIQITAEGRELAAEATKHLNADLFTQPGLPDHQLQALFTVLRDLRREAGDFA